MGAAGKSGQTKSTQAKEQTVVTDCRRFLLAGSPSNKIRGFWFLAGSYQSYKLLTYLGMKKKMRSQIPCSKLENFSKF
jgi:hypothetical protein